MKKWAYGLVGACLVATAWGSTAARADGILGTLTRLSADYDSRITVENGVGRIELQ